MIGVLVVEDSRVTRDYLVHLLESDPGIRVTGTATSGEEALASVSRHRPDVILMDIHLPGIDGFETTRRIMATTPVPIVACTSSTRFDEVNTAMHAIEAGALAALKKPKGLSGADSDTYAAEIIRTLKVMAEVRLVRRWYPDPIAPAITEAPMRPDGTGFDADVVAIGASTGGPPVISQILSALPRDFPLPILVVQHISAGFTDGFAEWLGTKSSLRVVVARTGELLKPGHVYIAPDQQHLRIGSRGELLTTRDEPRNGLRPSVGVLFRSVADRFGQRAVGVLLTGMGRDGAEELKLMSDRGALTVAQGEESCVVFGMPAEAIKLGAARIVCSPDKIASLLSSIGHRRGCSGGIDG